VSSESHGTIALASAEEERGTTLREVPLWEHAAGQLTLNQLVESVGPLHPAQAVQIMGGVCMALMALDRASRNSTGNPFPHLALSPANIALRENRVPVVLGWGNRAAFLAETNLLFPRVDLPPFSIPSGQRAALPTGGMTCLPSRRASFIW